MTQQVRSVMSTGLVAVDASAPARQAAALMRDFDVGAVIVMEGDRLRGIVTDRDIIVRCVAEGGDCARVPVSDLCSGDQMATVAPDDDLDEAVRLMRNKAIRRLPVMTGGRVVGVVSLGDLAVTRDPDSALGRISQAAPNQ